jgi:hypothetical protein
MLTGPCITVLKPRMMIFIIGGGVYREGFFVLSVCHLLLGQPDYVLDTSYPWARRFRSLLRFRSLMNGSAG